LLRTLFAPIPVRLSDEFGIPADAKEAIGFAILANETISGNPSNVPAATGASHPVILGKIVP
jgi:anhydro-N-acetylmuramic acid kinase